VVNKDEEQIVYGIPSKSDINRLTLSLIHDQQISENYTPAYDTIVTKYLSLAKLKNIKTINLSDDEHHPFNVEILKQVMCLLDRYE
jgi:hypothetical protein